MMILSVVAWVAFAAFFRSFWPGPTAPGESLGVFWAWLAVGGGAFVAAAFGVFRWFQVPQAWRANAAVALTGPALCLDVFTAIYIES